MTWGSLARGLALGLAIACAPPVPFVPNVDGGPRRDGGPFDGGPLPDAGPPQPIVDGVVSDAEWSSGMTVRASVPTDETGSTLTALRVRIRDATLFVAVEGTIANGDAILVYVDRALGLADGVDTGTLHDTDPALDAQLSRTLATPNGFVADFAWGTTAMPHTSVGLDPQAGWRNLARTPDAFEYEPAETAPTVCSATACETSIPLVDLGGHFPRTIALFARLARSDGTLTNQTLPEDSAATPAVVRTLLTIDDGHPTPDGGMPDGGSVPPADGGAPVSLRVDGTLSPGEWDAVEAFTTSATTTGTSFEGNRLVSLRAARTSTQLAMAIETQLLTGYSVIVYVDRDFGGANGLITGTFGLMDLSSPVNRSLSKELTTRSDMRIDFGWATTTLAHVATDSDTLIGWRDVDTPSGLFAAVPAQSACGSLACETLVDLSAIEVAPGDTIALFARLVGDTTVPADFSNQTLPHDDPTRPELVTQVVALAP